MQKRKSQHIVLVQKGLSLVCTLILISLWSGPAGAQEASTPLTSATHAYKPYPVIFEASHQAVLSAERSGVLTRLKYDTGSSLKKGAVIAQIDTGELALMKKRSTLALTHLERQVKELASLNQRGLATNAELNKARMERDMSRSEIDIFKRQIAKSSIRAPFACVVVRRHAQPHEWVTEGQPVVEVLNLNEIRAVTNIPAHIAVHLKKGDRHTFYVNDLDAEISGTVLAVAPEVDERSNTARVIWTVEKGTQKLLAGMKGEVRLDQ